jgi:methyltransferase (TIGR00027 family)
MMPESAGSLCGVTDTLQPSQTALTAAAARAAHLIVDRPPWIFVDTLAQPLLGDLAEELLGFHRAHGDHVVLAGARAQVTCRSRFVEDRLAAAVRRGISQYVVLGAGLDTFAYRSELAGQVRVFELDRPSTQDWKRRRLADAGIAVPHGTAYVPVDFETDAMAGRLADAGFDLSAPAVVSCLGVAMYLTRAAVAGTLAAIGSLSPGTEVVMDYMVPAEYRDADGQTYVDLVAPVAAERGEPWRTFLAPDDASALLEGNGFEVLGQVRQHDMVEPARWDRTDALRPSDLARVAWGRVA